MDTKICNHAQIQDPLAVLRGGRVVVGAKQLKKALSAGRVEQAFLAENADPALTADIEKLCILSKARYTWVRSMTELGNACGIDVGAAAAAVVK